MTTRLKTNYESILVGSIEKKYKLDLGVPSDMKLSTFLKRSGYKSLAKLLEDVNS